MAARKTDKCRLWGNALIRFCGHGLMLSSAVKFVHPVKAVSYMASMGFEGDTFYVVAALELISAVLFLLPATRRLGLLLVSAYLGGAIAAHLAVHRFFTGGPFLVYMAQHPYVGALVPGALLIAGWIGTWLLSAETEASNDLAHDQSRKLGRNFAVDAAS
jgi:DoxX-like family